MSHFFSVPELVGEVVHHLTYDCDCYGHRPCAECKNTLATVARVSGAFADFAFRRLWANLESWSPLLNLLPSSFRKKIEIQTSGLERTELHHYDLCAPIVQDEWDRFTYYVHFVRDFQIPRDERVSTPDIMTLVACSDGSPMLPRLERLGIKSQDDFPLYFFQMLHECLRTCTLSFPPHPYELHPPSAASTQLAFDHYLTEILKRVHERAPNIERLTLEVHTHGANSALQMLALFDNVRTLDLGGEIPCATLVEACAMLPNLETMSIYFPDPLSDCPDEKINVPNNLSGFRSLEKVTIKTPAAYALNLLNAINSPHLASVCVFTGQELSIWMSLTKMLATRFPRLRDVSLCIACRIISWYDITHGPPSFSNYFNALTKLRELQSVRLSTIGLELAVQDADLCAMAQAWPLLDTLMIEVAWDFPSHVSKNNTAPLGVDVEGATDVQDAEDKGPKRTRVALTSLQEFIKNCPALRFLELPLLDWKDTGVGRGASGLGSNADSPKKGVGTTLAQSLTLNRLRFTGARFEDDSCEEYERYLYGMFPEVEEIEYGVTTEEVESTEGQSFTWVSWERLLRWY